MNETDKRWPLSWPTGWKRTAYGERRRAGFGKRPRMDGGWQSTQRLEVGDGLRRLQDELRRLGARNVVISSNLRLRQDGLPIAGQAKVLEDPGVAVYFKLAGKPRVLACDKWTSAADNMAAIAGHIEAIRAQDRYGVGTLDQAFAGYTALPPAGGTQGGDWRAELEFGAVDHMTLDIVEARYRALVRTRHPDAGGSHDAIVRLNAARDAARKYFEADSR